MRAVRYHDHGNPDVLNVDDVAKPEPKDDEVLLEMRACSVNPLDVYFREGDTHSGLGLPRIPGSDFAGVVTATGESVTAYEPGDRVFGAGLAFHRRGTYAEYIVAPRDRVAPLPANVSFEDGAAIGHVGITAWHAIIHLGRPEPTDTCLIHGGSGGVGHIAVQLSKIRGARVITTAGSADRCERIKELGGDIVLDYRREDLSEAIDKNAEKGVTLTVDHLPAEYLEIDIDLAARNGRIVLIDGYDVRVRNLRETRRKDITIHNTGALSAVSNISTVLRKLGNLLSDNELTVEVSRIYPLEKAPDAQRTLVEESYVGKLVLVP